jgi:hypothetical protein
VCNRNYEKVPCNLQKPMVRRQKTRFLGFYLNSNNYNTGSMSNPSSVRDPSRLNLQWLKRLGLAVGLILLVTLPRLTDLSGYLIVDEADRWRWAEQFYRALIAGDLRATLVGDGYPGIVPVWLETIWLLGESLRRSVTQGQWFGEEGVYLLFHVWSRTTHLAQQRMPVVLFNIVLALLLGLFTGKVYGRRVGLVALVLIALSPFYLADARVNRAEAVITGLLTLSVLFLIRYGQTRQHRWLIVSGLAGGFSFLTKIQGIVILPVVGILLLYFGIERWRDKRTRTVGREFLSLCLSLALWILVACLVWAVLWPAMWVRPQDVLSLVFNYATRKVGSEGVNLFFMGRHYYNEDPGVLFYPIVALMRMTPLTMFGIALACWGGIRSLRRGVPFSRDYTREVLIPLLIYILLYTAVMSVGSHKQDRYLMPIFPTLDILAAMGWILLWDQLGERWPNLRLGYWSLAAFAGLLLVQLVSVLPYHPYYFSYFNPLLGGGRVGARTLRIGWGEGMDMVADYLNAKPEAANLTVAARWNQYMLDFVGKTLPFDETGDWTQSDYMVLYIHQTQRMLDPSPGVIRYFQGRQPEHVVRINNIEYAQIYPTPFTRPAQPLVSLIPGRAALFGYRLEDPALRRLVVIWENHGLTDSGSVMASLSDGGTDLAWYPCQTVPGYEAAFQTVGEVVESVCDLGLEAAALPTGVFDVRIGLADNEGNVDDFLFTEGWRSLVKEEDGTWRPAKLLESLDEIAHRQVPSTAIPVDIYYQGQIRLVGYELSDTALQPGQPMTITLYWQALAPVEENYIVFNHIFGLGGMAIGQADEAPTVPTSQWLPGELITTTHHILTESSVPTPAVATLDVGLYDAERRALAATDRQGQRVPVKITHLKFVPAVWPDPSPPAVDDALFGERLLLKGHSILPERVALQEDNTLAVQLWWQALEPVETDYAVFVHLVDEAGNIVAQGDGVPVDGRYPTSAWNEGESILDSRSLTLPADLQSGEYRLILGLYNPVDGSRLHVAEQETDSVLLGQLKVIP